jgi:hypothetical protein
MTLSQKAHLSGVPAMNKADIKARIGQALDQYLAALPGTSATLIPDAITAGKLYEAHVLACIARDLTIKEGLDLTLVKGTKIVLKAAPGPINQHYPHIEVRRAGKHVANIWTDVEISTLSYLMTDGSVQAAGHYHELDIVVVTPNANARPLPSELWLGVECKHTPYDKAMLRQILGIRRELSLLRDPQATNFATWPAKVVPASPPSCLLVYGSSPAVLSFPHPGEKFGIEFVYEPLV